MGGGKGPSHGQGCRGGKAGDRGSPILWKQGWGSVRGCCINGVLGGGGYSRSAAARLGLTQAGRWDMSLRRGTGSAAGPGRAAVSTH